MNIKLLKNSNAFIGGRREKFWERLFKSFLKGKFKKRD